MRAKLPWLITTVALVVAAAALTLLIIRKDDSPRPSLTVKRIADCHTELGKPPSAACSSEYDDQIRAACSNHDVAAVEMTVNYSQGTAGPITVVCSASMFSASGP